MRQIPTFIDPGNKDFPKGGYSGPPRPLAGLWNYCLPLWAWVSWALGWYGTRILNVLVQQQLPSGWGGGAACGPSSHSVLSIQPEREKSGSEESSYSGIRRSGLGGKVPPILGSHFSHLQSAKMTSEESLRANPVTIQTLVLGEGYDSPICIEAVLPTWTRNP